MYNKHLRNGEVFCILIEEMYLCIPLTVVNVYIMYNINESVKD